MSTCSNSTHEPTTNLKMVSRGSYLSGIVAHAAPESCLIRNWNINLLFDYIVLTLITAFFIFLISPSFSPGM